MLLQSKFEEGYGTVLDSGTTFTYLPSEAFKAFKDAVASFALSKGLKSTKGPDPKFYDICFGGAPHVEHADQLEHVFPHLELQFQEVRNWQLYFSPADRCQVNCSCAITNTKQDVYSSGYIEFEERGCRLEYGRIYCLAIGCGVCQ